MAEMTSRERVLTALAGRTPDRVPYMELVIDEDFGRRALGLPPLAEPSPMSGEAPSTVAYFGGQSYDPLQLARALDLDGFCLGIQPQIYFTVKVTEGQKFVVDGQIHSRKDLDKVQLVDPTQDALYAPAAAFLKRCKPSGKAVGCFINLGSDPVVLSMGWDHFSYALYDDPALIHQLFDLYSSWFAQAVDHINTLGFDFIWAGDDIAFRSGPMISTRMFREFFLPYYRRVAERIRLPWIFHSDGNILPLLEDLLSLGMDALHPIEPDAMDIAEVKQRLVGRAGLVGNIDINLLANGAPEAVAARTRETIQQIAPGGGYILSSSNSITRGCTVENVRAMVAACRRDGVYPIQS